MEKVKRLRLGNGAEVSFPINQILICGNCGKNLGKTKSKKRNYAFCGDCKTQTARWDM